jgi:hypothetical protein
MSERQYIDFKLYLTKPSDEQVACRVALLPTPEVGESMYPVSVPAEKAPQSIWLKQLERKNISPRQLLEMGKSLADCLLPEGEIRNLFIEAYKHAGREGGVRLRLIIAHNALREWPWEYTYLNLLGGRDKWDYFLALDPRVSFVRHEPLSRPHSKLQRGDADIRNMRLLLAAAQPVRTKPLDLEREVEIVKEAVKEDLDVDGVRIICKPVLMNVTRRELMIALQDEESPYIFHFAGHGITESVRDDFGFDMREEGYLLLVEDKKKREAYRLPAEDLADMLAPAGVRLVVLGACLSGSRSEEYPWDSVAGALVANDIPAVVAMQYEVIDRHAIAFSEWFYTSLASGLSLDEAMAVARKEMFRTPHPEPGKCNVEWGVPVLYSRTADGGLFPERMQHAGETARKLRRMIHQSVDMIDADGKVVGAQVRRVKGGVEIVEQVGTVRGELIGLEADQIGDGADVHVGQDIDKVEGGQVIGVIADEL